MTTTQYWKKLESYPSDDMMSRTQEAINLLFNACDKGEAVYVAARYDDPAKTTAKQLYMDFDSKRAYLCFTSEERFAKVGIEDAECVLFRAKDMVQNVLSKDNVFGFVFNPYCDDMTIVPIEMFIGYAMGQGGN